MEVHVSDEAYLGVQAEIQLSHAEPRDLKIAFIDRT